MHYCFSTCKYKSCPRCKIGNIEEINYQTEDGDLGNFYRCKNCDLEYYGDDCEVFHLNILFYPTMPNGDKLVKWAFSWHLKRDAYCVSEKWPNGRDIHRVKLPLLPLDITIDRIEQLLLLS